MMISSFQIQAQNPESSNHTFDRVVHIDEDLNRKNHVVIAIKSKGETESEASVPIEDIRRVLDFLVLTI